MATITYDWTEVVGDFLVNASTAGAQSDPSIVGINDGSSFFATWTSPTESNGLDIVVRTIGPDGVGGEEFRPTTVSGDQVDGSVTQLENGNILVTFTDQSHANINIRGQLFDSTGAPIGSDFLVVNSSHADTDADVAALADGGFVVTSNYKISDTQTQVRAAIYNADGSPRVSLIVAQPGGSSHVIGLKDGNFALAYEGVVSSNNFPTVFLAVYDANGNEVSAPHYLEGNDDLRSDIQLAALQDGGLVAAYAEVQSDQLDAGHDINVVFFNADGEFRQGIFRVNDTISGDQSNPTITVLSNGYVVIGWTDGDTLNYQAYSPLGDKVGENFTATDGTIEAEVAGLAGGLVANIHSSATADASGDDSIRGSIHALVRTTTGDATAETLQGDDLRDVINGAGGNDTLKGFGGDDTLNGGAGADTMFGNKGNDVYVVDEAGDQVTEALGNGIDTVQSAISYTLGVNVENLELTGVGPLNGTGNGLANTITGNASANILNGRAGADTLVGGGGNDSYYVDNGGDMIVESPGGGIDKVFASVSFTLADAVEKLTLRGTGAINGTGNSADNTINGNDAANVLDGMAGADTLNGGGGNDTYVVDNVGDSVVESGAGIDTVLSSLTFTLVAGVENLTLTGAAAIDGVGNSKVNLIIGNAAANVLDGGAGADTLRGGGGDDTYVVDNAADTVIETAGNGLDTVEAKVSFSLGAAIENLTLTGTSAINGTGNNLANSITGNAAANMLDGQAGADTLDAGSGSDQLNGGLGGDTLIGGIGADTFLFNTALGPANVDNITDFNVPSDTIALDMAIFTQITAAGTLAGSAFVAGTAAQDADDRIIYDATTGKIYYDADGNGGGAQTLFARVTAGIALTNADFTAVTGSASAASIAQPSNELLGFRDMLGAEDSQGFLPLSHHHLFSHPDNLFG
jgi:Ca2+-binding RTX toxin-like protein